MPKRVLIDEPEELSKYLQGDKSEDFKALVLRLVEKYGSVSDVSAMIEVPERTIYQWIKDWNEKKNLANRRGMGGGRRARLSPEEKSQLGDMLKEKSYWTTTKVRHLLLEKFKVVYSTTHIVRLLRSLRMRYIKPYPVDYRRPKEAEEIFLSSLLSTFEKLKKDFRKDEIAIGFMDESSPQNRANSQRVWALKKTRIEKNTNRYKANALGFYAYVGKSHITFLENAKSSSICRALEEIREANKEKKALVVILDNLGSHKTEEVRKRAEELGIHLVYLPPYSPDLNPIEQVWRVIKRALSIAFIECMGSLQEFLRERFYEVTQSLSFCRAWVERIYQPTLSLSAIS